VDLGEDPFARVGEEEPISAPTGEAWLGSDRDYTYNEVNYYMNPALRSQLTFYSYCLASSEPSTPPIPPWRPPLARGTHWLPRQFTVRATRRRSLPM